jgi:hypothetical protein
MKDFRLLAQALDLGIPDSERERLVAPLEALEASFRPLLALLEPETEPAYLLILAEENPR